MYGPLRIQGLADDWQEFVRDVEDELVRRGVTNAGRVLVARGKHLCRRTDFEVSIRGYQHSLERADPLGRRLQREKGDLEATYGFGMPPLPEAATPKGLPLGSGRGEPLRGPAGSQGPDEE